MKTDLLVIVRLMSLHDSHVDSIFAREPTRIFMLGIFMVRKWVKWVVWKSVSV